MIRRLPAEVPLRIGSRPAALAVAFALVTSGFAAWLRAAEPARTSEPAATAGPAGAAAPTGTAEPAGAAEAGAAPVPALLPLATEPEPAAATAEPPRGAEAAAVAEMTTVAETVAVADRAADTEPRLLRYPPSSARGWVIGGGVGLFAVAYGIGMACGFGWNEVPGADALKVPVVGPWVALGQSGCAPGEEECAAILVLRTILTTIDGLVQLGGVALVVEGLAMTTEADAPPSEGPTDAALQQTPRLAVVPALAADRAGVVVDLRF